MKYGSAAEGTVDASVPMRAEAAAGQICGSTKRGAAHAMVESLSKLAFFFRGSGKSHSLRKSRSNDLNGDLHRLEAAQRNEKPVLRSPPLRRGRWASYSQKKQAKGIWLWNKDFLCNGCWGRGLDVKVSID